MMHVVIRAQGQLDLKWGEWLDGLTITHIGDSETVLTGCIKDQSELYGLIAKLRDIGIKLISVQSIPGDEKGETV